MRPNGPRLLTRAAKDRIIERDLGICVYCMNELATQVDHVLPWSWDHDDRDENLVASCGHCNRLAGDKIFQSFEGKREYILARREAKGYDLQIMNQDQCPYCGQPFKPGITGTNICCNRCAEE